VACTRIKKGRGVCGHCWQQEKTIVVEDVHSFPGHIACSSLSRSEIVVPLLQRGQLIGVLDVDSEKLQDFDDTDRQFLEEVVGMLLAKVA
jgi:GAF domain-containing protein